MLVYQRVLESDVLNYPATCTDHVPNINSKSTKDVHYIIMYKHDPYIMKFVKVCHFGKPSHPIHSVL